MAAGIGTPGLSEKGVAAVRQRVGGTLVTPGIRPAGAAVSNQTRVMTAAAAILAGADPSSSADTVRAGTRRKAVRCP